MDKKNKIFFLVFFLLLAGAVAMTYWRIVIKKDYIVESQIDCDPYEEACFIWECDPASIVEGETCTGDPEADIWYYKVAKRNAGNVPLCNPETDESCDPWTCGPDEKDCEEILCDEENKIDYEAECNNPEEYTLNNPVEEEDADSSADETECEEGDEKCLSAEEADGEDSERLSDDGEKTEK